MNTRCSVGALYFSTRQWLDNPRYVKHASAIADFFCDRFSPFPEGPTSGKTPALPVESKGDDRGASGAMTQAEAEERADGIRAVIRRDVEHEVVQVRQTLGFR